MIPKLTVLQTSEDVASLVGAVALAILAVIIVTTLYVGREIFVPVALAILLSFVLASPVSALQRMRVPRGMAVVGVVLFAFAIIFGLGSLIATQLNRLAGDLPRYQATIQSKIQSVRPTNDVSLNWLNVFYAIEWVLFAGFAVSLWYRLVKDAHEREEEEEAGDHRLPAREDPFSRSDRVHVHRVRREERPEREHGHVDVIEVLRAADPGDAIDDGGPPDPPRAQHEQQGNGGDDRVLEGIELGVVALRARPEGDGKAGRPVDEVIPRPADLPDDRDLADRVAVPHLVPPVHERDGEAGREALESEVVDAHDRGVRREAHRGHDGVGPPPPAHDDDGAGEHGHRGERHQRELIARERRDAGFERLGAMLDGEAAERRERFASLRSLSLAALFAIFVMSRLRRKAI